MNRVRLSFRSIFARLPASLLAPAAAGAATLLLAVPAARAADITAPTGFNVETLAGPPLAAVLADGTALTITGSFGAEGLGVCEPDGSVTPFATGFGSVAGIAQSPVTGDIVVGDSNLAPPLHLLRDLNADGDVLDPGENVPYVVALPVLANGAEPLPYALVYRPGTDELFFSGSTPFLAGPTLGVVLRIVGPTAGIYAEGLGLAGGLFWHGADLYVADLDASSFIGRVLLLDDANADGDALDAGEAHDYAGGLSGANYVLRAQDGSVYVTGTFASDFSSGTVTRLLPDTDADGTADGADQDWVTGFSFTGSLFVQEAGAGLVPGAAGDGALRVADFGAPDTAVRSAPFATLALSGTVANNSSFTLTVGGDEGVPSLLVLSLDQSGLTVPGVGNIAVGFAAPNFMLTLAPIAGGQSSFTLLLHNVGAAVGLPFTTQAFTVQGGEFGISNAIDAVIAP